MDNRPILKLTDDVIGKIAAGEVVERPASAVKELVENSIDAGATAITVELKDGGIGSIRVSDNGKGIPTGQIRMAFERHATSKLTTADELFDVHTLGFRGEALASVAAVAKVTCTTRARDAEYGVKAQVEAGQWVSVTEAASPVGTTIVVRDLFFNTPVRLKFLKKAQAEAAMVSDYILRLILSRPDIAFRFVSQGKTVYRSAGDGTLESALYCVYGREALQAMRRVRGTQNGVLVDGYVGVGEQSRGNRLQQSFFINGRYFRDERISKALEAGCEGYVMIGRFPICALSLQMPYRLVDVNVHPNKLEVRFQSPDAVAGAVEGLTREALRSVTIEERLLGVNDPVALPVSEPVEVISLQGDAPPEPQSVLTENEPKTDAGEASPGNPVLAPNAVPSQLIPALPFISDVSGAWLAAENTLQAAIAQPTLRETLALERANSEILYREPEKRWIGEKGDPAAYSPAASELPSEAPQPVDNDAPAEPWMLTRAVRVQAEAVPDPEKTPQLRAQWVQESMPGSHANPQIRFVGAVFQTFLLFEAGERLLMVDQHAAHERILYDRYLARYQGSHVSQRLLSPQMLRFTARDVALLTELNEPLTEAGFELEAFDATNIAVRAVPTILGENEPIRDLLLDVLDETQTGRGKITRDRLRRRVAQMACKHAIKAGDTLSTADVKALLEQMLATGAQPTCPHGRPIVTEWTRRELEKRFKRIP
ncbi:MAG TPA: DNA mismatch repair endonuclease MutL [Candidatus Limiplasma sp.]|nr:DNA mismatch repair endonuclease MutL [Candidatus Limiplasma sp.]HPS81062.1 DNA mismatch repair endonuclease MutL [Candidatus Limiplasma sp.]